jgi:alpha-L-fucosidase
MEECVYTLLQTIGGDGNLLLNVGPMPDGRIEDRQLDILRALGRWVNRNQEAIYGTRGGPYMPTENLVSTHRGNRIFLHLLQHPGQKLTLPLEQGIAIRSASFLVDGTPVHFERNKGSFTLILPEALPDEPASLIVVELDQHASSIEPMQL